MKKQDWFKIIIIVSVLASGFALAPKKCRFSQILRADQGIDEKVRSFLDGQRGKWYDMNIQDTDGLVLYDLIIKHQYTKALEIGTSTGRSGIWIAWALSKTGGKLITIEIDEGRHKRAVENFEKAGLNEFVDARLADAHELVRTLPGPFDFVFVDADKEGYTDYLKSVLPKLVAGGCFAAHNVRNVSYMYGIKEFLKYVRSMPSMETTIDESTGSGISVSFKKTN
jgi:predicted O-methyltransferase YrrM